MTEKNIELAKKFYAAAPKGDVQATRALLDPKVEWIEPFVPGLYFGGTHHGPDAVLKEVIEPTFRHLDDFRLEMTEFLDAGEHVVALGTFFGRGKITSLDLCAPCAMILTFQNGKIVKFRNYTDTAQFLRVLGVAGVAKAA